MDGVGVYDGVDGRVGRDPPYNGVEKMDNGLMVPAQPTSPDNLAFKPVEPSKQGDWAVISVVVRQGLG